MTFYSLNFLAFVLRHLIPSRFRHLTHLFSLFVPIDKLPLSRQLHYHLFTSVPQPFVLFYISVSLPSKRHKFIKRRYTNQHLQTSLSVFLSFAKLLSPLTSLPSPTPPPLPPLHFLPASRFIFPHEPDNANKASCNGLSHQLCFILFTVRSVHLSSLHFPPSRRRFLHLSFVTRPLAFHPTRSSHLLPFHLSFPGFVVFLRFFSVSHLCCHLSSLTTLTSQIRRAV